MHGSLCVVDNTAPSIINCVDVHIEPKRRRFDLENIYILVNLGILEFSSLKSTVSSNISL